MRFRQASAAVATFALVATATWAAPASAQGGFFGFFSNGGNHGGGWFGQRQQRPYVPREASPYADPSHSDDRYATRLGERTSSAPSSHSSGTGRAVSYCVRMCDGRYFPIQRTANASPAQLCNSFCPAAKTAIYNGSQIDHAYTSGGGRYADLPNAFAFRQRIVSDCTCNGKDSVGLAKIDIASDPTLRQGDIVATGDNVKAALIAMHAAKERARDAAERPVAQAQREAARRTAPTASAAATAPAPVPQEATEDLPED